MLGWNGLEEICQHEVCRRLVDKTSNTLCISGSLVHCLDKMLAVSRRSAVALKAGLVHAGAPAVSCVAVRGMASAPAVADAVIIKDATAAVEVAKQPVTQETPKPGASSSSTSSASSSASASAPAAAAATSGSKPRASSSAWQRFVAFLTGVGVSSVWFYYTISSDVWNSTAVIENSLAEFRGDMATTNRELRQRIATLEHQMVALKAGAAPLK